MSITRQYMKSIPVEESVGCILCHDITQIVPGQSKGPVFRKGHVVQAEDIALLLQVGKENIYIYEAQPGILHENEAALRIATAVAGKNLRFSSVSEGRINFHATCRGLLHIDVAKLTSVNALDAVAVATLHTYQDVQEGQAVGGTRIIPLLIEEEKIVHLESLLDAPIIDVLPFRQRKVGIVTTGSEVYSGRIKDAFGPVLKKKFTDLGCQVLGQRFSNDQVPMITESILQSVAEGADMVAVTGGMSVDPDDCTPLAIAKTGARIVSYGAPTFPGAMFLLAHLNDVPIVGLPGCVMYHKASIFDLIIPRILAGIDVSPQDIAALGHGGFCASCAQCHYPICPFGKG